MIMVEMKRGFLLVSAIRGGSCLGTIADDGSGLGPAGSALALRARGDPHRRPTGRAERRRSPETTLLRDRRPHPASTRRTAYPHDPHRPPGALHAPLRFALARI